MFIFFTCFVPPVCGVVVPVAVVWCGMTVAVVLRQEVV